MHIELESHWSTIPDQTKFILECGPMPNIMAALTNIGGAVCESSVIPFLVRRRKLSLTPTARVPCSNAANTGERRSWTQNEFCTWQNSAKCIYSVPEQETAKHCAKFAWPPLSDVAAVTKPTSETRWNLLGCPILANRSQPLMVELHHIVRTCGWDIAV